MNKELVKAVLLGNPHCMYAEVREYAVSPPIQPIGIYNMSESVSIQRGIVYICKKNGNYCLHCIR